MPSSLRPEELGYLYELPSADERDKLLQILLYAAAIKGGDGHSETGGIHGEAGWAGAQRRVA